MEAICEIERGASPRPIDKFITEDSNGVNWIKIGDGSSNSMYISSTKEKITLEGAEKSRRVKRGDFILSNSMSFGHPYILNIDGCVHDGWLILRPKDESFIKEYLYHILGSDEMLGQFKKLATGGVVNNLNSNLVRNVEIPLPPLETQRQIVDEIAAHQRIIDGARQVVEGWSPDVELELEKFMPEGITEWEKVKLEDVCANITDGKHGDCENDLDSGYYFVSAKDIKDGAIDYSDVRQITKVDFEDTHRRTRFELGDILLSNSGSIGKMAVAVDEEKTSRTTFQKSVAILKPKLDLIVSYYLFYYLQSKNLELNMVSDGSSQKNLLLRDIRTFEISLPPLEVQREIVARIERERAIVEGNRELIQLYEEKVKKVIERVWEG